MTNQDHQRYGKRIARENKRFEKMFFLSVYRALNQKTKAVISRLKAGGYSAATEYLSSDLTNPSFTERIRTLYKTVGVKGANRVYGELDKEPKIKTKRFGFNRQWAQLVIAYLNQFLLEKITFDVTASQRDAMMKFLTEGIEQGLGVDEMVKRLQNDDGWPKILRYRTARIVRTEIKRAMEVGAKIASDEFEYEQNKEWIAITDNRVRGRNPEDHADHYHMNGQVVDANGVFTDSRSGSTLAFPGDPKAPAATTINCRCTVAYVAKRDERGRMIPKRRSTSVLMPSRQRETTTRRGVSITMPN
jgi:hypothetical protein